MTDQAKERFEKLKEHVASMSSTEREKHAAKGQANDQAIFDMIKKGDGVGLYASIQKDPSLLEKQDKRGMTPLHWANADKSGLAYEIFTSQPNKAPWIRDKHNRLPIDVAQDARRDSLKMERVTYPQLFRHQKDSVESAEKVKAFYDKHKEIGRVNTGPANEPDPQKNTIDKEKERSRGLER